MRDEADRLFNQAYATYAAGKLAEAEGLFEQAFALKQSHDIAANLGLVELKLGKARESAEHLAFALRRSPPSDSDELRKRIKQRLDEALSFVGTLRVKAGVAGAEIVIDGNVVGTEPLEGEVFVEPGAHTIEARLVGYKGAPQAVTVAKGQSADVALTLVKSSTVDAGSGKPPGSGKGEPAEPGGPSKGVIIAGVTTSVLAIGGGIVFAVVSSVNAADAEERSMTLAQKGGAPCLMSSPGPECEAFKSSLTAERTFGNLSLWSFVVGGALGAGTAIYALAAPKSKPKSAVQAAPVVWTSGGGLMVVGRW
jgi:hypothetical protein